MNPDAQTSSCRFITGRSNTQSTQTATEPGHKIVDHADGGSTFIGSARKSADEHYMWFKGFMYNLHIDEGFYQQFTPLHYGIHLDCNCTADEICAATISECDDGHYCDSGTACLTDLNLQ